MLTSVMFFGEKEYGPSEMEGNFVQNGPKRQEPPPRKTSKSEPAAPVPPVPVEHPPVVKPAETSVVEMRPVEMRPGMGWDGFYLNSGS